MDLGLSVEHGAARLVGEGAVTLGLVQGPGRVPAGLLSGERRAAEKDRGMAAFTAALWAQQATPKLRRLLPGTWTSTQGVLPGEPHPWPAQSGGEHEQAAGRPHARSGPSRSPSGVKPAGKRPGCE